MSKKVKSPRGKSIADGAEKFSERRREILRTARRNSPPGSECRRWNRRVKPRHCCGLWGMSDGANTIAAETVGNYAEAAQQLKLKVGGWVHVSLEFTVNDRKTQDGRKFKAQRVRILNISPLWGHEEPDDKAF